MSDTQEMSFDLLFTNDYSQNIKPPNSPPPPTNKKLLSEISPKLNYNSYINETPPKFYLNQKFDIMSFKKD